MTRLRLLVALVLLAPAACVTPGKSPLSAGVSARPSAPIGAGMTSPLAGALPSEAIGGRPSGPDATAFPTELASPGAALPIASPVTGFGRVLGLDVKPAAGVLIRAFLISDSGAGIMANHGGGVISNGGGSVSRQAGFRLLAGDFETVTDAQGAFTLSLAGDGTYNVEAVQSDQIKALLSGVSAANRDLLLQLAPTGTIAGRVVAAGVTNLQGVDVYVPGSSYLAKTDEAGAYLLSNLPAGVHRLFAAKAGLGTARADDLVVVSGETSHAPDLDLTLTVPAIAAIVPAAAEVGARIVITGENFGAASGGLLTVSFGGALATTPQRDGDRKILVTVPAAASTGDVVVSVDGIASKPADFRVIAAPTPTPRPSAMASLDFPLRKAVLRPGTSRTFPVFITDAAGAVLPAAGLAWRVEGAAITVDIEKGLVTARDPGSATLIVTNGPMSARMAVEVAGGPLVETVFLPEQVDLGGYIPIVAPYKPLVLAASSVNELVVGNGLNFRRYVGLGSPPVPLASGWVGSPLAGSADGSGVFGTFTSVTSLLFGGDGNYYASEAVGTIRKITGAGQVTTLAGLAKANNANIGFSSDGKGASARFAAPGALALGEDGTLYVADGNRLRRVAADGTVTTMLGEGAPPTTERPVAVYAVAVIGMQLYLTDPTGLRLLDLVKPEAPLRTVVGAEKGVIPRYLAVEPDGTMYTASAGGSKVFRTLPGGEPTVIAGGERGSDDGPRATALFDTIHGLSSDHGGHLYILDGQAPRIRRVDLGP